MSKQNRKAKNKKLTQVWVWQGEGPNSHPSAVFTSRRIAHEWITQNGLQGVLTAYPLDISVYDWHIAENGFKPKSKKEKSPEFIQNFDTEYLDHYHYVLDKECPEEYFLFPNPGFDE